MIDENITISKDNLLNYYKVAKSIIDKNNELNSMFEENESVEITSQTTK